MIFPGWNASELIDDGCRFDCNLRWCTILEGREDAARETILILQFDIDQVSR